MLVFEKPLGPGSVDLTIDMSGMNADEAAKYVDDFRKRMSPRNINLGCGPEPDKVNLEAVRASAVTLMGIKFGDQVDMRVVQTAEQSGAWFYWRYATELAKSHLKQTEGEVKAETLISGADRKLFCELRVAKMRWVMQERFGIAIE